MSAVLSADGAPEAAQQHSEGVWHAAWRRFKSDRVGLFSLAVVLAFFLLVVLSGLNLVAQDWQREVGVPNAPPTVMGPAPPQASGVIETPSGPNVDLSAIDPLAPRYKEWDERARKFQTLETVKSQTLPFGGDRLGRDVLQKAVKGTEISVFVGVAAATVATLIGVVMGAFSGFFGGKVGDLLEWVYNVFESIPNILLIFAFAAVVGRGVESVVVILALTGWTSMYRQVRAEFIKHASREYVRSAEAIGASTMSRMFKHILPNVSHVVLVRMSLLTVGFIKAEVILSFLGLGNPDDRQPEWGQMLGNAQQYLGEAPHLAFYPAACIIVVALGFTLMGESLREAIARMDPESRNRNGDGRDSDDARTLFGRWLGGKNQPVVPGKGTREPARPTLTRAKECDHAGDHALSQGVERGQSAGIAQNQRADLVGMSQRKRQRRRTADRISDQDRLGVAAQGRHRIGKQDGIALGTSAATCRVGWACPGMAPSTELRWLASASRSSTCTPCSASASSSLVLPLPVGPVTRQSPARLRTP